MKFKEPFVHSNGEFRSNGKEILDGAFVVGRYDTDGLITIVDKPTSQRQGKIYRMMRDYNDYLIRSMKRETIRRS